MGNLFESRNVGKCLTEYIRRDYADVIGKYNRFVVISQFDSTPSHIDECDFKEGYGYPKQHNEPFCGYGNIMFGVEEDGTLTKLKSIIDSSD